MGSYEILVPLGAGGMGEVYRAKDLKLGRDVAIKVLPERVASEPERLARFEREARAASALNHPNIITIYDIDQHGTIPFIAMELVDGSTLRELLDEGRAPLPETRLIDIAGQIAEGMAKAHAAGIVHRDLKPDNLMVTTDGYVKILDFGLAKLQPEPSQPTSGMPTAARAGHETGEGVVVGTVQYMSPEQASGRPVDFRSDQFSFGSILYEMATGRMPFRRESQAQSMAAIIEDEPEPVEASNANLSPHLGVVVRRCLSKDPRERYDSTRDLAKDIKFDSGSHDRAPRPVATAGSRALRSFALVAALALASVALVLVLRSPESPASLPAGDRQSVVVLPFENLGPPEDEYFADGVSEEITARLGRVEGIRVVSRKSALRYAGTDKSPREIGEELGVDFILGGSVRWAPGAEAETRVRITPELVRVEDDSQIWSEAYDRVLDDIFEVQSDIASEVIGHLDVTLGEGERRSLAARPTDNPEAYTLYLKGRHFWNKRTAADIETGLGYFQQAVAMDPDYALAHAGIADVWIFRGWYSVLAPKETFPQAKQAALRAIELDERLAEPHASLAHIHLEFDHDWDSAEREYKRAIDLDPRYPTAHHWYGGYLSAMGRHAEALRAAETARELDPLSLIINTWVGLRHYFARRYDVAIEEYEKALQLGPGFAPGHWHYGWALEQVGRFEEAIAEAQRAIELSGGNPLYVASLAHAHAVAGEHAEARRLLDELNETAKTRHVSAYHVAVLHGALGDLDEGFVWLDRAFEEQSPWIGYMNVDPRADPFRSDPRFDSLLRQARLAP